MAKRKTTAPVEIVESVGKELYENVRAYISAARAKVYAVANAEMVKAYWNVGREIVEKQGGNERSAYGDGLVDRLAAKLTAEFGPGYTRVNLFYMRRFYLAFPNVHTLCKQLSWSCYRLSRRLWHSAPCRYQRLEDIPHLARPPRGGGMMTF